MLSTGFLAVQFQLDFFRNMLSVTECVTLLEQLALDTTKAAEISISLMPLPNYGKPAGEELLTAQTVDDIAQSTYPDDADPEMIPVKVAGDGNCLYHAPVSLLMCGNESHHLELRLRCPSQRSQYYATQLLFLAEEAKNRKNQVFCQPLTQYYSVKWPCS